MKQSQSQTGSPYEFYGKIPLRQAIPLGLQHVLAMFVGNLTPILIICGACGISATSGDAELAALQVTLLQNAMLIAGIVTLVQLFAIGPVGGKVPIIMGTSSGFIGVFQSVAKVMGGGILTYGAIMGASLIGGIFEGFLGFCLKPLRKFFPPIVTGTVVLSIGLSLISVGIQSFGGGSSASDYGSMENLILGLIVLVTIIVLKHFCKGIWSTSAILFAIIIGYIVSEVMGIFLPTTDITAEGVEFTKAWVLNWSKVADASWFAVPKLMPVKLVFDARAILPILIMFVVTAVETVGDISGVMEGGMGREATDKELSGGVACDGFGSSLAALFGVLPNTSFSQNVGLVTMTKIVNRTGLRSNLPDFLWPLPEAGGPDLHHAPECSWRCGRHDVLLHHHQRNPADHEGAHEFPLYHNRLCSTWSRLWPGGKQCRDLRPAPARTADLRRFRHGTCSPGRHRAQYCSSQRKSGAEIKLFKKSVSHRHLKTGDTLFSYPSATSSTIMRAKPTAKPMVPMLLCSPSLASGISSSTTT